MLDKIRAVIFDLDGTMVDSMWMWKEIDIEFLSARGIALPDNLQNDLEGMSFTETAIFFKDRFNLHESIDEIKDTWNSMADYKYENEVPLKTGIKRFLDYLKENNIKIGIATSNSRELVNIVLKAKNIDKYIDIIVTGCDVNKGKPAPDVYLETARRLNVNTDECLVFEDVPMGIIAGKSAGMKVCAIDDDYSRDMEERKRALADYFIYDYNEIFADVKNNERTPV